MELHRTHIYYDLNNLDSILNTTWLCKKCFEVWIVCTFFGKMTLEEHVSVSSSEYVKASSVKFNHGIKRIPHECRYRL